MVSYKLLQVELRIMRKRPELRFSHVENTQMLQLSLHPFLNSLSSNPGSWKDFFFNYSAQECNQLGQETLV